MVVRCVKTLVNLGSDNIINNDMSRYLKEGDIHIVYGIRISRNLNYFMIYSNNHLIEVPSSMFEIVEGKVSFLWIVRNRNKSNDLTIWPELFYEDNFFENFSDWKDEERRKFEELKQYFEV